MSRRPIRNFLVLLIAFLACVLLHSSVGAAPVPPETKPPVAPRPETKPPAAPRPGSDVIAVVEGIPLTQVEWDRLAQPYFEEVQARAGRPLNDEEKTLLKKNVLDELVRERLWLADAKRRGFTASEPEIDARLQRNPYFQTNGKLDERRFRDFKLSPTSNYPEIKSQIALAVLLDKYVKWIGTRYAPTEAELKKEFALRTAQAALRYFWLTADAISLDRQAIAGQIRAYYETHPEEFQTPEEARLSFIRIPVGAPGGASDSLRGAAEAQALTNAKTILGALKSGKSPEPVAKPYGGVKDTGKFRIGDPIRGLGRSDALFDAVRAGAPSAWLDEPVKVGPYYLVARIEEKNAASRRPFRDVVGLAKRRADGELRDAEIDSLARADYRDHPEAYRVPLLNAVVLARSVASFEYTGPVSEKDVARTLERLRKSAGMADTARAWADSVLATLPDRVRRERQLDTAFRTMGDATSRLRRGEREEETGKRFGAVVERISIYQGQPPAQPMLLEGASLDSLYGRGAGEVWGPRVLRDSIFVARVTSVDPTLLPPFEAIRARARSQVEIARRKAAEREAASYFAARRDKYLTPQRWVFDYVYFRMAKPDEAPVPEDSMRAYYATHALEFTVPGKIHARHILVSSRPGDGAQARAAAHKKALDILARVRAGEDFAALAKEFSDDRGSAAQSGDLGEITRGEVVKEFGDAAFALTPGLVSDVVETQFGFHIIKVEQKTPEKLRPIEDCRAEIRGVLGEAIVDSLARGEAAVFIEAATKPGAPFDDLAKAHGGMKTTIPVGVGELVSGLGVIETIESDIGSLSPGGVTPRPIRRADGYLVARLKRSIPPQQAPFGEVKDRVTHDLGLERKRAVADSLDASIRASLRAGADLESLLVPLGGLRTSRFFGRMGPIPDFSRDSLLARDTTLIEEAFSSKPGAALVPRSGALGVLYAVVDTVVATSAADFAKARASLRQEMMDRRSEAWTARLRSRAKIEIHRKDLKL